jgi:hypothetical protein
MFFIGREEDNRRKIRYLFGQTKAAPIKYPLAVESCSASASKSLNITAFLEESLN